jgi:hypothetical protein
MFATMLAGLGGPATFASGNGISRGTASMCSSMGVLYCAAVSARARKSG